MAKVKKGSVSPKKRGREANKNNKVEASTSKTETRSRSKSNTSKKVTSTLVDVDIDSGISSPEKPRRTPIKKKKRSSAASTVSKISQKSKSTISKYPTTKNVNDVTWLKGLLQDELVSEHRVKRTASGIVARYPRSLSLRVEDKIEYVTYPWNHGKCGGYIKIAPGLEKIPKVTATTMIFLILMGKIHLLSGDRSTEYKSGTVITMPKGVKYGLKNTSKETCFMRFQSICD